MHPIELGLAFLEGLALIVSPCILPMLPLVLATSIDGGRARPFGIIVGFVAAFTAFAYLSRELVQALDINTEWITNGSLVLLALFGFILLSERLSDRFSALTGGLAQKGQTLSANAQGGFGSGLVIGALIGLVWTPCAGPILAAVLVQVIRQESDISALAQLAAFAFGAGVPMLIIALMGRQIMGALGFLSTHAVALRKGFGVLILLAVAFIASGWAEKVIVWGTSSPNENEPVDIAYPTGLREALDTPYPAPPLEGITTWLNSQPLTLEELQGKVVLIDFWTYSCINCIRTFPYITQWHEKYKDDGLVIIGVHAPEFEFEKRRENVEAAIAKHGITYPVAMDNDFETWLNYENHYPLPPGR